MGQVVASDDGGSPGRRRYHSPLRAQRAVETRATVIDAATRLFTTGGWVATGMRDVARDAGVSVETVYSHFPSKRKLLDAVIDHAVMGDSEPVAVAQRPEFVAMGQGRRSDRIAAAASIAAGINLRTARFAQLIREAATSDEEIAEVLRATRERQRSDVEAGVALILGRAPDGDERDGTWAIVSPEVYLLLVEQSGWTVDRYERWLSETLARVLPRE
jgi:AcrR family transcriptional regulator